MLIWGGGEGEEAGVGGWLFFRSRLIESSPLHDDRLRICYFKFHFRERGFGKSQLI